MVDSLIPVGSRETEDIIDIENISVGDVILISIFFKIFLLYNI